MTPAQFLARMKRKEIAPAYLFLGAEAYQGRRCREACSMPRLVPVSAGMVSRNTISAKTRSGADRG